MPIFYANYADIAYRARRSCNTINSICFMHYARAELVVGFERLIRTAAGYGGTVAKEEGNKLLPHLIVYKALPFLNGYYS